MSFFIHIYIFSTLQTRQLFELTDILSAVTASDSECEELSSGDECSDDELWELGAEGNSDDADINLEDIHGNDDVDDESGSNNHNDGDNDDVRDNPKAQKKKANQGNTSLKHADHLFHQIYPLLSLIQNIQHQMTISLSTMSKCS